MTRHSASRADRTGHLADTLRLHDGLAFQIRVVSTRANQLFSDFTGQDSVTPRQYGALLTLHQRGPLTLSDLASIICVDRSTLTEMARRLERDRLVTRSGNGRDRRSAVLALTQEGEAAVLRLSPGAARVQEALLAPLDPAARRRLLGWVKLIAAGDSTG